MFKAFVRIVAVLVIVALALPVMAKPVTKSIKLMQSTKVGTTQLDTGEYKLLIDGDKVTIQKGKEVVATVSCRWEQRDTRPERNAYVIGPNGDLQEFRFAGDNRVLVLGAQ
jgi:hypothetical protein